MAAPYLQPLWEGLRSRLKTATALLAVLVVAHAAAAERILDLQPYHVQHTLLEDGDGLSLSLSWKLRGGAEWFDVQRVDELDVHWTAPAGSSGGHYHSSVACRLHNPWTAACAMPSNGLPPVASLSVQLRVSQTGATSASSEPVALLLPTPAAPVGPALSDWAGAEWICTSPASDDTHSSMLRTEFSLSAGKTLSSAVLNIVGLGQFSVRVNGAAVVGGGGGGGVDTNVPGWTDFHSRILYSSYSLDTSSLLPGPNALAVTLGNGMYNVPDPQGRYTKFTGSYGPRMLLAQLSVSYTDGSSQVWSTSSDGSGGSAWTATDGGPIVFVHQYAGEDYNASLATPGWDMPGFNPGQANPWVDWTPAQNCAALAPRGALQPSSFEPVRVMETLPLVNISTVDPSLPLLDFGRNHAGFATISLSNVPAGLVVRVTPSETVRDGRIDQSSGGTPMYWQYFTQAPAAAAGSGGGSGKGSAGGVIAAGGAGPTTVNVTVSPTFSTYGWRWATVQLLQAEHAHMPNPPSAAPLAVAVGAVASTTAAAPATATITPASAPSPPSNGTATVLQASYGVNCNAGLTGDATVAVGAWCNGNANCSYAVCVCGDNTCGPDAPPCLPDPAQNCAKDFAVSWSCSLDPPGSNRTLYIPAEADNQVAWVTCEDVPPPPTPTITAAVSSFTRASVATVGTWSSSSPWVNAIHEITVEAVKANLQSVLTDCPHRERLGWLEVSHLMLPSIAYSFDVKSLWSKISMDTVDSQLSNGMVPDIAPEYTVFSGGFRDSPEWGSAAILNPAWVHSWYGTPDSAALLNATYATGQAYVEYLLTQVDPSSGLLTYGLGDWIPVIPSPAGVTATAIFVQDLATLAQTAEVLGKPADAARYTALAANFSQAYQASFWTTANASYPTQCAAGMGLALNITPAALVPQAQAYLLSDVLGRGNVTTAGEIGNRFVLLALGGMAQGQGIAAVWASLLRSTAPGYGWMLTMGETALAETWFDSATNSHIHAMYGHVDEFLYRYIAGIQQDTDEGADSGWAGPYPPGHLMRHSMPRGRDPNPPPPWTRLRLAPWVPATGLEWVNATFDSPRGMIKVAWEVLARAAEGDKACARAGVGAGKPVAVRVTVSVPPGTVGSVVLPLTGQMVPLPGGREEVMSESLC